MGFSASFGIDNELAGSVPHHQYLYLFLKSSLSPSLSAIYFTKVNHCLINHCLTNHRGIRSEFIWTVKTTNAGGWLKLGPLDVFLLLLTSTCPWKECVSCYSWVEGSILSTGASWLIMDSNHLSLYWFSAYLFYQLSWEGCCNLRL